MLFCLRLWKQHTHTGLTQPVHWHLSIFFEYLLWFFNLCESMFNDTRITSVHPSGWLNLLHTCKRSLFVSYTHSQTYICIPHLFSFNFPIILSVFIYLLSAFCPTLFRYSLTIIFRRVGDTLICLADFAVKWGCCSRILLHCLFSNSFNYSFIFFSLSTVCDTAAVHECLTQSYQGQEGTVSQEQ